jgi:serine/threonine-protein kinase
MKFRALADLGQSALGPMRLVRVESGRYNGRLFALQRVDPSVSADWQLASAILDEAFITAVVFSRNVVQFIAWGHDDEGTYIAIELVQGASLVHLLKAAAARKESIPDRVVGFICSELSAGLHALHSVRGPDGELMGLAHGRLCPSNVLLSFKGEVKIADVGLAWAKERVFQAKLGGAAAEAAYMAPEQTDGRPPDVKSDLFSFGVILFELLTGRPPWVGSSPEETRQKIASEPPPDLASVRRWCDPFFVEVVRACLEKDPERRLGSAGKLVELTAEWHASRGFGEGDQEALAKIVQRLGSHQMEWFRRALAGELARPDATALFTALDRVDFGVDPQTRRAGGTVAPPPPAGEEAVGSRAASILPGPGGAGAPEARAASMRPASMRPAAEPPSPNPKPAKAPEARAPEIPEPRQSVPAAAPSVKPPSGIPEARPSSPLAAPAAESWFPSMWPPAQRGGDEGRGSVPPSNMTPSGRFAFVSRWAVSTETAGKDEERPSYYRTERPSQPGPSPSLAKPGSWLAAAQPGPKPASALSGLARGALTPPRLPSIPSPEQPLAPLRARGEGNGSSPPAPDDPPSSRSSRPEPMPATLRTGSHALVQNLDKTPR